MTEGLLRVGQVASKTGVSVDLVRHYERLGLLPKSHRSDSGYRLFPPGAVGRVQLIRAAVAAGFSLRQLAEFLRERDAGGTPCGRVRAAAAEVRASVDRQISDLRALRRRLDHMLAQWDVRLAATPRHRQARLLDSFAASPVPAVSARLTRRPNRPA